MKIALSNGCSVKLPITQIVLAIICGAQGIPAFAADGSAPSPSASRPMTLDCWAPSETAAQPLRALVSSEPLSDRQSILTLDVAATAPEAEPASAGGGDAAALAKKLANPIASLISVPFQYNADFNAGASGHAHKSYLNIQPVIPIELNKDWNLITRTIIPVIYQEALAPGQGTNWGLGDVTASFFFSPKADAFGWIWGVGPVLYLPTGTDTALGSGKWAAGPTVVALRQEKGWTYGILANHLWSFCGDDDRANMNATFLQPFIAYTFPTATTITLNTESTYDWNSSQWTMPVNLLVSQVVKIGGVPISLQAGPRYYAEGPSGAPEWGIRFGITLMFPK